MKKRFFLLFFLIASLIYLFGCDSGSNIRDELIERAKAYDLESLDYKSFDYTISLELIVSNDVQGEIAREKETEVISFDMENQTLKYDGAIYFEKNNTIYTQAKNSKGVVFEKKANLDTYNSFDIISWEELFIDQAKYEKDGDKYTITTNFKELSDTEFYEDYEEAFDALSEEFDLEDIEITMVFEFDGDEFTFTFKMAISKELNDKFINGKLHDTVTQKAEIIVISKIHNVNNVTIELYDPSEHQFALNSTFEEAVDNLYGLKEVNKETKYINFTTNNQIGDNYLPIKITEAGNYKFTHSNIKFEIYDINKQEVVGDYFKEGLYIIRILNNQSAKSSKINVAYYELNDYDTFENPREILNETINLNLENVYDRQIYSYEVSESGVYQFDSIAATKIKIDIYDSADLSKKINTLTNGKESIILDEGKKYLFVFYCDVHNDLYQDYDINLVYHGDVSTKSISITEEWSDEFLIYRDGKDYKLFFDVDKTGVYVIEVMDSDGDISSCNIGCLKSANGGNQIPEELEDGTNLYYLNSGQNYYYYFNQVNDFYKGKFRYRFIAETTFIEKEVEFANEYITITEVVPTKFSNVKVYFTVGESSYLLLKKGDELPPIYNESHNKVTLIGETYMDEVAGFEVYKYRILEPGNYYFYCTETINMLGSNISFTVKLEPVE